MDILQGTLDLLILRALELAPMHGVGIAARIEQVTRGAFLVKPGSLFPALRRLESADPVSLLWRTKRGRGFARAVRGFCSLTASSSLQTGRRSNDNVPSANGGGRRSAGVLDGVEGYAMDGIGIRKPIHTAT